MESSDNIGRLLEMTKQLFDNDDTVAQVREVLAQLAEGFGAREARLYEYRWDEKRLFMLADSAKEIFRNENMQISAKTIANISKWLQSGDVIYSGKDDQDIFGEKKEKELVLEDAKESIFVPAYFRSRPYGFLVINCPSRAHMDDNCLKLAANFLVAAWEKEQQLQTAKQGLDMDRVLDCYNEYRYQYDLQTSARKNLSSLAILIVQMKDLKKINRVFGQGHGDRLLEKTVSMLSDTFGKKHVYRTKGDEFSVLIRNANYCEFASAVKDLEKDFDEKRMPVDVGYMWEYKNIQVDNVCTQARDMLEANKEKTKEPLVPDHIRMLLDAIRAKKFKIYLQPRTDLKTGELIGCEGLARFMDEKRGPIEPKQFIPVLESNRTIRYVDIYVFEEACKVLYHWKKNHIKIIPISVNFSRVTLLYKDLMRRLMHIIHKYDVDPGDIEIEITESVGELGKQMVVESFEAFQQHGFHVLLDDFGTAYSNMELLLDVTPARLKIDQTLITGLVQNEKNRILVDSIIQMSHRLQIPVVAEGVEREAQADILRQLGCDESQGYLDGVPMPVKEFLIEKNRKKE